MDDGKGLGTRAVRDGVLRSQFGEHAEGLYLTSSFVFADAAQAAARFLEQEEGYTYSRFTNPTVSMFQERLASLEEAEACIAAASGMAAILCTAMAFVSQGEEIVAGQGLFGATHQLFSAILPRFGITTRFVDLNDATALESALTPRTKLVFCETPSNPLVQLVDLAALAERAHRAGALLAVDNTFCTPSGSSRSPWGRISSSIRPPSTSMARAGCSAERCSARVPSSTSSIVSCARRGRAFRPSMPGCW